MSPQASASSALTARTVKLSAEWCGGVRLIAGRELANYFDSAIAYVYTIGFVVFANSIFMNDFFLSGTVEMAGFFDLMPLLLAVFVPAVTMRLWAEERKQRTIELLLTLPITPQQAVLGKFAAAMALYGLFLLGSLPIVVMLLALGSPDLGRIAGGYLGLVLLGSQFIAFGMLLSAVSADQIVAFVLSTVVGFSFVLTGNDRVVAVLDGLAPSLQIGTLLYESVSVVPHFEACVRGVVQLTALVYFVGLSAFFLWFNALLLQQNRT
jgi:ABC-type Na+ efflux pump permease subunit